MLPDSRIQQFVFKNCLAHAGLAGVIPLAELPERGACDFVETLWREIEVELPADERASETKFDVSDNVRDGIRVRVFQIACERLAMEALFVGLSIPEGQRR